MPVGKDGFFVYGLSKTSASMTIGNATKNMGDGCRAMFALLRLSKSGILTAASNQTAQDSITARREASPLQTLTPAQQVASRAPASDAPTLFRMGPCVLPAVTHLTGEFFKNVVIHAAPTHSGLTVQGKCHAVRERHRNELLRLQRELSPALLQLPLAEALVRHYQDQWERKRPQNWQWASLHREIGRAHV